MGKPLRHSIVFGISANGTWRLESCRWILVFLQIFRGVIGILSKEQKDIKRRNTEGLMI
ncbi:MAG: hypothetical protein J7K59_03620 [Candidatus Korarchaeota archaeon]|nr:hypothetical protein [Candidatus Korarchaeota archaeon]